MEEEEEKTIHVSQYTIFKPKSARGMFSDYPELRQIEKFKKLSNDEMLFVWFYACEASPYHKIKNARIRIQECLNASFLKTGKQKMTDRDRDKYLNSDFPDKLVQAIASMSNYKIGPRVRAKLMVEKILTNIEHIVNIDASDKTSFLNKDGEEDMTKKKAYVDMSINAAKALPDLISKMEGSFNVSEEKEEADFSGESLIDNFMDDKD